MTTISGGIYLIADADLERNMLINKLTQALESGISIVQLYNTKNESPSSVEKINAICTVCHQLGVPVLVNNHWRLLGITSLDGVHFDKPPEDIMLIEETVGRRFVKGITCSNDLEILAWADRHGFDYLSFCSMFPTRSASQCEIVSFDIVKKARALTTMPFFAAGGIYLDNIHQLPAIPLNGIAVISGIMAAKDIPASTKNYITELNKITGHEN